MFHTDLWQHRGAGHPIEGRGILAEYHRGTDGITVWASTQKAHDLFQSITSLFDIDEVEAARGHARGRRRLRSEALHLFGRHRGGGGGEAAQALDQMDRGPPRAFHQCGAGARPVLVDRHRGRRRRQGARHPRQSRARRRRLRAAGRQHPVQFRVDDERALYRAGAAHGRGGRRHQQDAGLVDPRRRLSAGRVRDGADDGPRRARAEARPRRGAAAQPHPRGEDALHQAAEGALRRADAIRQRRLSGLAGGGAEGRRLGRFPEAAGRGARSRAATSASASRTASRAPAAGRSSPAWCGSPTPARSRCSPAPPISDRGCAPCWRRSPPASLGCARRTSPWCPATPRARALGLGAFASRQMVTAGNSVLLASRAGRREGEEARQPSAGSRRARSRIEGRRGARGRRAGAVGQARRAVAHPQGRARLRLPARRRARASTRP